MIESSAAALKAISDLAIEGNELVSVRLHDSPLGYSGDWAPGDALARKGDAHIHVDAEGNVKEVVPPVVGFADRAGR
jgi:hypothetical protein